MNKKFYTLFTICLALLTSACTQQAATIVRHPASSPAKKGFVSQNPFKTTVQKGDTLYSISKKNNVEVRAVIDANKMRPPYTLLPGQTIKLPNAAFHIVSESDNLYSISRSYNIDIGRLAKKNGLSEPYNLTKGQKLYLTAQTASDNDSTPSSTNIKYDFATNQSYDGPRNVESSDLAPIGKSSESKPSVIAKSDDSDSPFSNQVSSSSVQEEKISEIKILPNEIKKEVKKSEKPETKNKVVTKEEENLDKKTAAPFTYKSESAFGDSDVDNSPAPAKKPAETSIKKSDTKSVNNDTPTPIASSPIEPIGKTKTTEKPSTSDSEEEPFAAPKATKAAKSDKSENFIWPTTGKVISGFGPKKGGLYNDGINISAQAGAAVRAASDGEVVYAGNELRGYGNMMLIKHNNGYLTAYAHTSSIAVKKGDTVKKGQTIGYVGQTGHVSSPQLHFSIRQGRKAIDPEKYSP